MVEVGELPAMSFGIKNPTPSQLRGAQASIKRIESLQSRFKELNNATATAAVSPDITVMDIPIDSDPTDWGIEINQPVQIGNKIATGGMEIDDDGSVLGSDISFNEDGKFHEYSFEDAGRSISYHERVYEGDGKRDYHGNVTGELLAFRNIHIDPNTGNIVELALGGSELK